MKVGYGNEHGNAIKRKTQSCSIEIEGMDSRLVGEDRAIDRAIGDGWGNEKDEQMSRWRRTVEGSAERGDVGINGSSFLLSLEVTRLRRQNCVPPFESE